MRKQPEVNTGDVVRFYPDKGSARNALVNEIRGDRFFGRIIYKGGKLGDDVNAPVSAAFHVNSPHLPKPKH